MEDTNNADAARNGAAGQAEKDEPSHEADGMIHKIAWCIVGGGAVVFLFALGASAPKDQPGFVFVLGGGLALAGAAVVCGALLGFIFGIPRALQHSGSPGTQGEPNADNTVRTGQQDQYSANTSLEQVSDWLTKILVGVGLTQLLQLPTALQSFSEFIGPKAFGTLPGAPVFAGAAAIYFSVLGFLLSYLWTRLYLAEALERRQFMQVYEEARARSAKCNLEAIEKVSIQLSPKADEIDLQTLAGVLAKAEDPYRAQAWERASDQRKSWRKEGMGREPSLKVQPSPKVQRTIRVFEALIKANEIIKHPPYHQNEGEIGFAWYDLTPFDQFYTNTNAQKCVDHLTKAIAQRGQATAQWWTYELVRALALIRKQKDAKGNALDPDPTEQIKADLLVVAGFVDLKDPKLNLTPDPDCMRDEKDLEKLTEWINVNPISTSTKPLGPSQTQ